MDTMQAFLLNQAAHGNERKVFDWDKAVDLILERGFKDAFAGLQLDLEWTMGQILEDGKPVMDSYCYLASNWAVPVLVAGGEEIPCYVMESKTKWDAKTIWPKSALNKLKGAKKE